MPALCGVALLSLLKTLTNRHSGLPWSRSCLRLCYRFCLRFNLRFCSRFYLRLSRCKCLSCSCFTGRFDFVFLSFLLFGLLAIWVACNLVVLPDFDHLQTVYLALLDTDAYTTVRGIFDELRE